MTVADIALTGILVGVLPTYMMIRSIAMRGRPPSENRVARYRHSILLALVPMIALAAIWLGQCRPIVWLGLAAPGRAGWILLVAALAAIAVLAWIAPRAKRPGQPDRHAAAAALMPVGGRELGWYVGFALTVGVSWEVLYRGFLLWALAPHVGTVAAVLVMGFSYGIAHGFRGAGALAASILSALLFAAAYAVSQTLWWLIVLHIGLPLVSLRITPRATP